MASVVWRSPATSQTRGDRLIPETPWPREDSRSWRSCPPLPIGGYLPALVYPVTATWKPFLAKGGASEADVERMHQAWIKSVMLQVILWSEPYVRDGEF